MLRHLIDFHDLQSLWLFPAEGQQAASQFCRASCCKKNLVQLILKRAVLWGCIQSQFRITGDDRQKIVEVMRNAARKSSNGVHLLRLYEVELQDTGVR